MAPERDETEAERMDRNWNELLQELRVTQTGVQLLTGFLLSLPFQQRFAATNTFERACYLGTLLLSVAATALLIMPVSYHRIVFRRHDKAHLVAVTNRLAQGGIALLALAVTGVVLLIVEVVVGLRAGLLTAAGTLAAFVVLWGIIPLRERARARGAD